MLQFKKFTAVFTAVTVCTLFTAGFTPEQANAEDTIKTASHAMNAQKEELAVNDVEKVAEETIEAQAAAEAEAAAQAAAEAEAAAQAAAEAEAAAQAAAEAEAAAQAEAEAEAAAQAEAQQQAYAAETELLAALIYCEAGNQPYEGQVAVGAVVMNRVYSGAYPNSISEVIYQSGQFGPAMTGWLDSVLYSGGYTSSAYQAAQDAIAGANPVGGCLSFGNGNWGIQIGDHFFH